MWNPLPTFYSQYVLLPFLGICVLIVVIESSSMIFPILCTILSSYGLKYYHTKIWMIYLLLKMTFICSRNDIWEMATPINAYSRVEEEAIRRFEYASVYNTNRIQILTSRKDGGDMIDKDVINELIDVDRFLDENIPGVAMINGTRVETHFGQMCGVFCRGTNDILLQFLLTAVETKQEKDNIFQLNYPNAKAFDRKVYIAFSLGNVELDDNSPPNVLKAGMIILHYMVDKTIEGGIETEEDFEHKIEAIIGIVSPAMALWTSFGLLWIIGMPSTTYLTVVPFLVLIIGIDDAFLVLAGWRHSRKGASLEERMGESVAISGASVTVTSITDVLCFGTGLFSNLPAARLFCTYTAVALAIDFIYQMTIFPAVMSLIVRKKVEKEQYMKDDTDSKNSLNEWMKMHQSSSLFRLILRSKKEELNEKTYLERFVEWIHTPYVKWMILGIFLIHVLFSTFLLTKVTTKFDIKSMYLKDSPLISISEKMQDHLLKEAFTVNYGVYPMPDFTNSTIRKRFEEMLTRLERIPYHTYSTDESPFESTNVWTRDYVNASIDNDENPDNDTIWDSKEIVNNIRMWMQDEHFFNYGKDAEGNDFIEGFFFIVTYKNFSSFPEVEPLLQERRAIVAEYKDDFTVHGHHQFDKVPVESEAATPSNFVQTVVAALILMSIFVLLFVMDFEAIISVVLSLTSICIGVVAYLHLWDVHLDPVTLLATLMSIGFSVDYSTHICYHFFAHANEELKEKADQKHNFNGCEREQKNKLKLLFTLEGVGWPILQSCISTVLGIIPIMFVHAYVTSVFWKTIFILNGIAIFHALLFLPIVFSITDDVKYIWRSRRMIDLSERRQPLD